MNNSYLEMMYSNHPNSFASSKPQHSRNFMHHQVALKGRGGHGISEHPHHNHHNHIPQHIPQHHHAPEPHKPVYNMAAIQQSAPATLPLVNARSAAELYMSPDEYKFRQLPCRTFISVGTCPYRERCVYLHDPRIICREAKSKTRKKNKEDETPDSLFWPVLPVEIAHRRVDSSGQPFVIQQYHVPIPQMDTYQRHDEAVYSLWNCFTTLCAITAGLATSNGKLDDPNMLANDFTGQPRIPVFVKLSQGFSMSSPQLPSPTHMPVIVSAPVPASVGSITPSAALTNASSSLLPIIGLSMFDRKQDELPIEATRSFKQTSSQFTSAAGIWCNEKSKIFSAMVSNFSEADDFHASSHRNVIQSSANHPTAGEDSFDFDTEYAGRNSEHDSELSQLHYNSEDDERSTTTIETSSSSRSPLNMSSPSKACFSPIGCSSSCLSGKNEQDSILSIDNVGSQDTSFDVFSPQKSLTLSPMVRRLSSANLNALGRDASPFATSTSSSPIHAPGDSIYQEMQKCVDRFQELSKRAQNGQGAFVPFPDIEESSAYFNSFGTSGSQGFTRPLH